MKSPDKSDALVAAAMKGDEIELVVRIKCRVDQISNSHGLCARVSLEKGNFIYGVSRSIWIDADEIQEIIE